MNNASVLVKMCELVRTAQLDGWLLYDFRGLNPFPAQILDLGNEMLTRRWFLYAPANGPCTLIHHRIEMGSWEQILPGDGIVRQVFASHEQLGELLSAVLKSSRKVAMEYSPLGEVPYVSYVDAGTLERVRACGVEVCSSADLLQHFLIWDDKDRVAHEEAVRGVIHAKDLAFQLINDRLKAGQRVTELEVQEQIMQELARRGLEYDHAPIVAFGSHASDGHYSPSRQSDRELEQGQCVLIDLWAGIRDRPMADITWVGFAGNPSTEYLRVWEAVREARDLAIELLRTKAVQAGWEVDRAARQLIAERGYGAAFRHRLGHSLGRNNPHGSSVNLDDWETHDTRLLLPGLAVTVEPGVYLGSIGIRSEVNILITESGAILTTPAQSEPYRLGLA
jgi:Xaa-Pro aminopeptidase